MKSIPTQGPQRIVCLTEERMDRMLAAFESVEAEEGFAAMSDLLLSRNSG